MKFNQSLLLFIVTLSFSVKGQETITYAHCNCQDIIETLKPVPNGSYKRVCNDVTIETGNFNSGVKTGEWISYNSEGNQIKTINYLDGTLNGDVSYFYNNGKKKLTGSFVNGLKAGDWKFYNQKEKIQWEQFYKDGIPVGKSLVYDKKGKKIVVSFDYEKNTFEINAEDFSLFEEQAELLQDPTSSEWFILLISDLTEKTREMNLDEDNIESQLFKSLVEIPSEIFNTYLNVNYNVELTFENFGLKSVDLKRESAKGEEYPLFAFAVMTNDPEKLSEVEHSEFTLSLLDSKIKEAISIFPPWQIENGKFDMGFIYVVNKIEGREEIDQY